MYSTPPINTLEMPVQASYFMPKVDRYWETSLEKWLSRWTSLQPQGRSALFPVFTTTTACCLLACLEVVLTSFRPITPWLWRCVRRLKTSRACPRPSVSGRQKRSIIVVFWYIVQDASRGFALPSTQLTPRLRGRAVLSSPERRGNREQLLREEGELMARKLLEYERSPVVRRCGLVSSLSAQTLLSCSRPLTESMWTCLRSAGNPTKRQERTLCAAFEYECHRAGGGCPRCSGG
jgi:hypothetical protein